MKRALVQSDKCANCAPCPVQEKCGRRAVFRETEQEKPWVDFYRCSGCMVCKTVCRFGAIVEIAQPCTGRPKASW